MTYEEAKMQIQAIPEKIWDQLSEPDREAMEMAFSALQAQEAKHSTESSLTQKELDTISRQEAIDAECEVCQIAPKKERGHNCTYYVHGCKEIECLRELPSAHPEIEERKEESAQNVPKEDLISRKAAIDALGERPMVWTDDDQYALGERNQYDMNRLAIETLPSAQPEIIYCKDCKYYKAHEYTGILACHYVIDGTVVRNLNDFCSRAERREE